jgi:methyl-accepting chemotaxis protein
MKNLRIAAKIALCFGFLLAIVLALSGFAISQLSTMSGVVYEMTDNWLPSVRLTSALDASASKFRIAEGAHILSTDEEGMRKREKEMDQLATAIAELRKEYEPLISSAEEQATYDEFARSWDDFLATHAELLALSQKNQNVEAGAIFKGAAQEKHEKAAHLIEKLVAINVQGAASAKTTGEETYGSARLLLLIISGATVLLTCAAGFGLARSTARPIKAMTSAMTHLSQGDLAVAIPAQDQRDEIGHMAQAVQVFKDNAIRVKQLEADQKAAEEQARQDKKRAMNELADRFQGQVGGIVDTVSSAASEMQAAAQSMTATAEETSRQAGVVSAASEEASTNVQTVATAAEELSSSISEISRQVVQSTQIAGQAVEEAGRTNSTVQGLARSSARRRSGKRVRGGRLGGQEPRQPDQQSHRGDQLADLRNAGRDQPGCLRHSRHRPDHRASERHRHRHCGRGRRAERRHPGDRAHGAKHRRRNGGGLQQHRRRHHRCCRDRRRSNPGPECVGRTRQAG